MGRFTGFTPSSRKGGAARRRRAAGFTLMEIMAVVGIIVVMASIVVGGFSGIQRALGASNGAELFRRALSNARQQACVDGVDIYVWCTDVDKFIICRKGGTVSGLPTRSQSISTPYSRNNVSAHWVHDEFADVDDFTQAFIYPERLREERTASEFSLGTDIDGRPVTTETLQRDFMAVFKDNLVFDVTKKKLLTCAYPPFYLYSGDYEGCVFGIKSEDYQSGALELGNVYAWPTMPLQSLPGGYAFDGSWNANTGEVNANWLERAYVHFFPDGQAETGLGSGFTITEVGVSKPRAQLVTVSGDGQVTVVEKKSN